MSKYLIAPEVCNTNTEIRTNKLKQQEAEAASGKGLKLNNNLDHSTDQGNRVQVDLYPFFHNLKGPVGIDVEAVR